MYWSVITIRLAKSFSHMQCLLRQPNSCDCPKSPHHSCPRAEWRKSTWTGQRQMNGSQCRRGLPQLDSQQNLLQTPCAQISGALPLMETQMAQFLNELQHLVGSLCTEEAVTLSLIL